MAPRRLSRVAGGAFAGHRNVVVVWVLVILALVATVKITAPQLKNSFTVPGTNSQQALDVLNKDFPSARRSNGPTTSSPPSSGRARAAR